MDMFKFIFRNLLLGVATYFGVLIAGTLFHVWIKAFTLGWNFVK